MKTNVREVVLRDRLLGALALGMLAGVAGCKAKAPDAATQQVAATGSDPATANLAPVDPNAPADTSYPSTQQAPAQSAAPVNRAQTRVLGQRSEAQPGYSSGESYPEQQGYPQQGYTYNDPAYDAQVAAGQDALDAADEQPLYAEQAPPPLPVYDQPELTDPNTIWTPGYWSYAPAGYYWVPGAWVAPPYAGALWTPGYWGYGGGHRYRFHHGFWGRYIGFYGGIPYGFGYTGYGYQGGYWQGNTFFYNRQVNRVNVNIVRNVYVQNVTVINNGPRYSFNGPGGYTVQPRPAEIAAYREQRLPAMQTQVVNLRLAQDNRAQFFSANSGRPAEIAVARPIAADRVQAAPLRTTPAFADFARRQQAVAQRSGPGQPGGAQRAQSQPTVQGRPAQAQGQIQPGAQNGALQAGQGRESAQTQPLRAPHTRVGQPGNIADQAAQQQRAQEQQHTVQAQNEQRFQQQRNAQAQQPQRADQQRTQQPVQQRAPAEFGRASQPQARAEQSRPQAAPQPQVQRAQPAAQPQVQRPQPALQQRPQPQVPHAQQAPQPRPQPAAPAAHPAVPAQAPHGGGEHGGPPHR